MECPPPLIPAWVAGALVVLNKNLKGRRGTRFLSASTHDHNPQPVEEGRVLLKRSSSRVYGHRLSKDDTDIDDDNDESESSSADGTDGADADAAEAW